MMLYSSLVLEKAHDHCNDNRVEIENSVLCGCFYCMQTFPSNKVVEWVGLKDRAVCPKCGIDSVIGSVSGFPIAEPIFLEEMYQHWFGHKV